MIIDLKTVVPSVLALWILVKKQIDEYSKIINPILQEVEQRALDGKIDKDDRRKIALCGLKNLEKEGKVKLNFITRIIVVKLIDYLAKKLPDYYISENMNEILNPERDKKPS
jgi:hypothetical protein